MKYVFVDENSIVIFIQSYYGGDLLPAPDEVTYGWIYDPVANTFSAPPLTRHDFEEQMRARLQALQEAKLQNLVTQALMLSPNYPGLPDSIQDFELIMDGMELPT